MAILLAWVLTLAVIALISAVAYKSLLTAADKIEDLAGKAVRWACEPWKPSNVKAGAKAGYAAATPARQTLSTPTNAPVSSRKASSSSTEPATSAGATGTTAVEPTSRPAPSPEMVQTAQRRVQRGGDVGYRTGWHVGTGAASGAEALRHGPRAAREAWRAARVKPEPEVEDLTTTDPAAPESNAPTTEPAPESAEPTHAPTAEPAPESAEPTHAPTAEPAAAPEIDPLVTEPAATPEPDTNTPTSQEPTGPWAKKESTDMAYKIPSEIPDHTTLIAMMEGVLTEVGAGDELNAELVEMSQLLTEASTVSERLGRDFGRETSGAVGAFEEAAAIAKTVMDALADVLQEMLAAAEGAKAEATVAIGD